MHLVGAIGEVYRRWAENAGRGHLCMVGPEGDWERSGRKQLKNWVGMGSV